MTTPALSLPESQYLHRYLFVKVSALVHRTPRTTSVIVPEILSELHSTGLFAGISAYLWTNHQHGPSQFHAGSPVVDIPGNSPHRADWSLPDVAVSVLATASDASETEANSYLLGFVSQQIARLAQDELLRATNAALRSELQELNDALLLRKLLDRAASLLVAEHRVTLAQAREMLLAVSREHGKSLLSVVQDAVLALGSPIVTAPYFPRRHSRSSATASAA